MTKGMMYNKDRTLLNLRAVGEDVAKHDYGGSDGYSHFRKQFCLITRALHCSYSLTQ